MGRDTISMLDSFLVSLLVGTVLGFLAGLGVGGGSLLMVWLTGVLALPYPQAKALNLLFFLPSALIATVHHLKKGTLNYKKTLPAVIAGSVCAALFYWIGTFIDTQILKKCFGGFLLLIGLRELLWRPKS